jgi:glutathione S-transferase
VSTGAPDPIGRVLWGAGTSRAMRAHWALAELGLEYRHEPIGARTGETGTDAFGRLNPRRKIPVLEDGALVLTESPAIVTYLCERYSSASAPLFPCGLEDRARYYEWMSFISMELDATSLYVLRRHEHLPEIYGEAPVAVDSARAYFERMIQAAAAIVDDGRAHLLGEPFTGVDILMTTCLDWAVRYGRPIPEIFQAYRARTTARPAYAAAVTANAPP